MPAMQAGLTDRLWDIADIVALVDAADVPAKKRGSLRSEQEMSDVVETRITPEASEEETLISKLQEMGGEANNGSLRSNLGWNEDTFWSVRNRLLENGRVQKAHGGPGGKTILLPTVTVVPDPPFSAQTVNLEEDPKLTTLQPKESDLYEPIRAQLDSSWVLAEGYDSRLTRITAMSGSRLTGGKWTRPDVTVVAIQKFKFLRDPVFDVISFEIKPSWQINVEGVFEALSHRQYTTRAYVIYHANGPDFDRQPEANRITALAEQHGVGVLLADDPSSYLSWIEKVSARRWSPDPVDLNDFIQRVFPASDHDAIIKLAK